MYELVFSPCDEGQKETVKLESKVSVLLYKLGNYWSFIVMLSPFPIRTLPPKKRIKNVVGVSLTDLHLIKFIESTRIDITSSF
jgi:hypothetical protein